ncbi:Fructose-1,6-bisphosphatase 1 class 2 [Raoultella planticola]|uniref:fructose-bisphosphatase n=1 Tax=Raoultella planticola TaxID=575 RepID=A0A485BBW8_RAOPL|nr:Fructose-1,6-bisphosphatase 1 class 2 [Raoultella planticola]
MSVQGQKGAIDLNLPLAENLRNVAAALNKPLAELTVTILAKPRHDAVIAELPAVGRSRPSPFRMAMWQRRF